VVPPVTTEATADLTFGLMLAVARRMMEGDRLVRAGNFPAAVAPSARLLRLGQDHRLVGGGGLIGKAVARRAHGFSHARALLDAAAQAESEEREAGLTFVPLDQLLPNPTSSRCTSRSRRDASPDRGARARLMKKTAFLINTARGAIVDEAALVRALRARRSPAPASTCSSTSPRSTGAARMPNVVLAPHLGSATVEVREEMANIVVDNIPGVSRRRDTAELRQPGGSCGQMTTPEECDAPGCREHECPGQAPGMTT
jgi:glyoxylate reductase